MPDLYAHLAQHVIGETLVDDSTLKSFMPISWRALSTRTGWFVSPNGT